MLTARSPNGRKFAAGEVSIVFLAKIIFVGHGPSGRRLIPAVRKWSVKALDPCIDGVELDIVECADLPAATTLMEQPDFRGILIAANGDPAAAQESLAKSGTRFEAVICVPKSTAKPTPRPLATLIGQSPEIVAANELEDGLRKAMIRLRAREMVTVRELEAETDFLQYFGLRYRVWKQLGYLEPERDSPDSKLEVDFTDLTSHPIGAFAEGDRLVACGRLVRSFGEEVAKVSDTARSVVTKKNDPILVKNLEYPRRYNHPFDILESFPGFRDYYRELVKNYTPKAEVSRIIVEPEFRRHGLGEVIVDSLVSLAYGYGLEVLFLACLKKHRTFYERSGFRAVEGLKCESFVNISVPAIAMERRFQTFRPEGAGQ